MIRCLSVVVLLSFACVSSAGEPDDGFEPLFNGRDLDNWVLTNTPPETWSVRDGMLVCSGKPYGEIRTKEMFQNFIFEVEWRHLIPRGNAGIFLWADDIPARGVPFHRGIEVQVLELAYGNTRSHTTHGDIFPIHGARMTPDNGRGGSRAFPTEMKAQPAPEWNHYRITCSDGAVTLAVNGTKVTSGQDASPRRGYLCLESEGGIVHYRNLRLRRLPDTPIADDEVAISDRGYQSIYTGLNLSGWLSGTTALSQERDIDGWTVADWKLRHSGEESELHSQPLNGRSGFLLDVRNTNEDAWTEILLVDGERTRTVAILGGDESTDGMIARFGAWNRVACDWQAGSLLLTINGREVAAPDISVRPASAPTLILRAIGSIEFANLFVR